MNFLKHLLLFVLLTAPLTFSQNTPYGTTVVSTYEATAQTTAIGTTTLYTPTADGWFRISIYINRNTNSNQFHAMNTQVNFTDDHAARTHSPDGAAISGDSGSDAFTSASYVFRASNGNAITFDTIQSDPTVFSWDIRIVLEKL